MEVKRVNEMFGIFIDASDDAKIFFSNNGFFVLLIDHNLQRTPVVQKYQHENRCFYTGILVATEEGRQNFRKNFHERNIQSLQREEEIFLSLEMGEDVSVCLLKKICLRTRTLNKFGVFSIKDVNEEQQKILSFMGENEYIVIDLDHEDQIKYDCVSALEEDVIAIVVSTKNMTQFKDIFHRSGEYVSSKTISPSIMKELVMKNPKAKELLENMEDQYKEIQIRVMKEIRVREKHLMPA